MRKPGAHAGNVFGEPQWVRDPVAGIHANEDEALVNWEEERLYASIGRRKEWVERRLKDGSR